MPASYLALTVYPLWRSSWRSVSLLHNLWSILVQSPFAAQNTSSKGDKASQTRVEGNRQVEAFVLILITVLVACLFFGRVGVKKRFRKRSPDRDRVNPNNFTTKTARKPPKTTPLTGRAYIIDGDTLAIQSTQVRLFGIDAPELDHPYGKNAKGALLSLCKGHDVRAEIIAQDAHGRTVARCYLADGRDLSAEMVKLGLAIDWAKFSNGQYRSLELLGVRKKLWLADARQKGRMDVWEKYAAKKG